MGQHCLILAVISMNILSRSVSTHCSVTTENFFCCLFHNSFVYSEGLMPKWSKHKRTQHNDFLHVLVNLCFAVCWKRCPLHFGYFTKAHSSSTACLSSSHTLKPTHTAAFCRQLCMYLCVLRCFFFLLDRKGSVEKGNQLSGPSLMRQWPSQDDVLNDEFLFLALTCAWVNRHAAFRVFVSLRESDPLTAKPAVSRWRSWAHSVWSGFGSRWNQWPGTHRRRRAPHCCNTGQQFLLYLFWTRRQHGSQHPLQPPQISHPSVFCSVSHSSHHHSASNTGGMPQRSKCVKCAWNEKNKFWIRGESTFRVHVVTSVYVQVPFMKMKLALKRERKKINATKFTLT